VDVLSIDHHIDVFVGELIGPSVERLVTAVWFECSGLCILFSLSLDGSVGKMEAAKSVTSVHQETIGVNTGLSKIICEPDDFSTNSVYSNNHHKSDELKMAITEYIRNLNRAILNMVFENTVRRVNKCVMNVEN